MNGLYELLAAKVLVISTTGILLTTVVSFPHPLSSLLPSPSPSFHYFSSIFTNSNFEMLSRLFLLIGCKCIKFTVGI